MIRTILHQTALALTSLFLAMLLVLPYNGGYPLAYALMGMSILLTLALLATRERWHIGVAGWCFLGAYALMAVAMLLDNDPYSIVMFVFLPVFVPLASWLRRFAAPDSAVVVSLLAMTGTVLSAITALWEVLYLHRSRALGWGSDPIWSAEAALILGFLALVGLPQLKTRWRFALLVGPVLGTVVVVLSGSRGPLLAAPVMALALTLTTFRPWWKQIAAAAAVVMIAGLALLPLWPSGYARVQRTGTVIVQLLTTGEIAERSAGARLAFWKAGTLAFLDRPVSGYGWSHYVRSAYQYLPDKGEAFDAKGSRLRGNHHLHADLLNFGVAGGALGMLSYLLLLLAPLLGALRSVRDGQRTARLTGAVVLSTGYAACGLTYLMLGYEFHNALYVCLSATILAFCRDAPLRS